MECSNTDAATIGSEVLEFSREGANDFMFSGRFRFTGDKYKVKHQVTSTGHTKWVNNESVQNLKNHGLFEKASKANSKLLQ